MGELFASVTASIIDAIEKGAGTYTMPWHAGATTGSPRNAITKRHYHGVNPLILWAAAERGEYSSPLWATYRQWAEAGAQVRKGEKSTVVLLFRPVVADTAGETNAEHQPSGRSVARAFRLFNAQQVDGFEPAAEPALSEAERIAAAEAFFAAQDATVWFGSDCAMYDPRSDTVSMPVFASFKNAVGYYTTLAHELGHWTGAEHRLARDLTGRFGSEAYAGEELVAELTSAFIAAHLGLTCEPRQDHAGYIGSWLQILKGDKRAIVTLASSAQAAADFLIERARGTHLSHAAPEGGSALERAA